MREQWSRGEVTLGGWVLTADPLVAAIAGSIGFDYVGIDVQHGAATGATTPGIVSALAARTTPLVRVSENAGAAIGMALDAGALGVIVPMVESAEQARMAVSACRYPPEGARSFGPAHARILWGADYGSWADDVVACIPMIETVRGLDNVDEIMAVPGVDAVYVGPADLSLSLGLPPVLDHEDTRFGDALEAVTAAARRHGVVAGAHANAALTDKRIEQGFGMITVSVDQPLLTEALARSLRDGRDAVERGEA
ncbi:hypothetical protein ASC77_18710 [Nocardioides sp. Root1257]|nr:hypothetical protein ASC77_18710 [Nocardioides sp. Root1257]KRC43210.1 hypothetical protein ASE24_19675 [Nocardioides sp. Root224]